MTSSFRRKPESKGGVVRGNLPYRVTTPIPTFPRQGGRGSGEVSVWGLCLPLQWSNYYGS